MKFNLSRSLKAYILALILGWTWTSLILSPMANAGAVACETNVTAGDGLSSVRIDDVFTYYHHFKTSEALVLAREVFGSDDDVLLGFNEAGHVYVQNDGVRVDGNTPLRRSAVQPTEYIPQGIVIRVPKREVERAVMMSYRRSRMNISCAHTACRVLNRAAGIIIGKGGRENRPDKLLLRVLKEGLYAEDGSKVPFEVYVVGNDTFLTRYKRYYRNSDHMNFTYWAALPAVGLGIGAFIAMTVADALNYISGP